MADEHILSQDELNALLGADGGATDAHIDLHALGEALRLAVQSAADVLGQVAGVSVGLSVDGAAIIEEPSLPAGAQECVAFTYQVNGDVTGELVWAVAEPAALALAEHLGEAEVSSREEALPILMEAMNVAGVALGESLSSFIRGTVEIVVSAGNWVLGSEGGRLPISSDGAVGLYEIGTEFTGVERSLSYLVLPVGVAERYLALMEEAAGEKPEAPTGDDQPPIEPLPVKEPIAGEVREEPKPAPTVKPAEFAPLGQSSTEGSEGNLDLLLDVPLRVTVELGRAEMQIRDILSLSKGQVIELDKLAGEPVDVYVNEKLMAKGEVVVMDEHFGVKITHIISRTERVRNVR